MRTRGAQSLPPNLEWFGTSIGPGSCMKWQGSRCATTGWWMSQRLRNQIPHLQARMDEKCRRLGMEFGHAERVDVMTLPSVRLALTLIEKRKAEQQPMGIRQRLAASLAQHETIKGQLGPVPAPAPPRPLLPPYRMRPHDVRERVVPKAVVPAAQPQAPKPQFRASRLRAWSSPTVAAGSSDCPDPRRSGSPRCGHWLCGCATTRA